MKSILALFVFLPLAALAQLQSPLLSELPDGDSLKSLSERIGTTWADANISTGTTALSARQVSTKYLVQPQIKALDVFKAQFKYYTDSVMPKSLKIKSSVAAFKDTDVEALVVALADGNAFDTTNPDNLVPLRRQAWALVRELGKPADLQTAIFKTTAKDNSSGENRRISSFQFINMKSQKVLLAFVIEGTM